MTTNTKKFMNMNDIMNGLHSLSKSQGFYSRLYRELETLKSNDIDQYNRISKQLERQHFHDIVDLIIYLEE